jgi:hypothetical protein
MSKSIDDCLLTFLIAACVIGMLYPLLKAGALSTATVDPQLPSLLQSSL